jgi:16S rRNA (guanine(1405)-N(7))-methyltransferase
MTQPAGGALDQVVEAVQASRKYRAVCVPLIRRVAARELAVGHSAREAIKITRNKLHQVGGAYFAAPIDYGWALDELQQASNDPARLCETCLRLMRLHVSTRERVGFVEDFYQTTMGDLAPVRSVLDVACGLNPLAIPWMPLVEGAQYHAYDIYTDLAAFLGRFMALAGVEGCAGACDVIQSPPPESADVALLLKAIPCLEQIDPEAGPRLLDGIDAPHVIVSFPARSIGGRQKGMLQNYERRFQGMVAGKGWDVQRFEFPMELVFRVSR